MSGQRAPGPYGGQLRACLNRLQGDVLAELMALHAHYGDIVRLPIFPRPLYLFRHPDAIQHILRDQAKRYRKGNRFKAIAAVQGQGLLTSEGDLWRQQRRLMQPIFRQQRVILFHEVVSEEAQDLVHGWRLAARSGDAVNVTAWLHRLAFRVVGRALLGLQPSELDPLARRIEAIAAPLIHHITAGNPRRVPVLARVPTWLPSPRIQRFRRALRAYHDIAQHIVDKRRQTMSFAAEADTDLLSRLIRAHDAETGLAPQQLRDEIITLIGAGVETSATALSWAWYILAQYPESTQRLHAEIDDHLNGRTPLPGDLAALTYSRMILEETMRLYPPSAILPRQANTVDHLETYTIPKHAVVLMSQYVTHRHPDFWPAPERFDPERFTPARVAQQHRFAYFPFGAGPRVCIGKPLALLEMHLTLVILAQTYVLRLIPERPVQPALGATLYPRGGLWMTVHERS
ncbi:cytochrome P450 [Candidatus Entotheonella serta]|nr:cytochrome P450 [Candidatus Entotheonella serta]